MRRAQSKLTDAARYDSTHLPFRTAEITGDNEAKILNINAHQLKVYAEKDPANIKWSEQGVDIVIEATGIFKVRPLQHLCL
jgi:glyceraldehyde 3-phosphate dehydrogenase